MKFILQSVGFFKVTIPAPIQNQACMNLAKNARQKGNSYVNQG